MQGLFFIKYAIPSFFTYFFNDIKYIIIYNFKQLLYFRGIIDLFLDKIIVSVKIYIIFFLFLLFCYLLLYFL
jgi:hypothetical protein